MIFPVNGGGGGFVGWGTGVLVGLAGGLAVGLGVAVGGNGVLVGSGVSVTVGVRVGVGVSVGRGVSVAMGVLVGVLLGVGVGDGTGVLVGVEVAVKVGLGVRVGVEVALACLSGLNWAIEQASRAQTNTMIARTTKRLFMLSPWVCPCRARGMVHSAGPIINALCVFGKNRMGPLATLRRHGSQSRLTGISMCDTMDSRQREVADAAKRGSALCTDRD